MSSPYDNEYSTYILLKSLLITFIFKFPIRMIVYFIYVIDFKLIDYLLILRLIDSGNTFLINIF